MKIRTKQSGLTIIEILVVVAVIAILVTITVGITSRVDTAIKERKTRAAIDLLATALEKYYQFHKAFPLIENPPTDPQKCDMVNEDYDEIELIDDLKGSGTATIKARDSQGNAQSPIHNDEYSSIEGLYHCLGRTPICRDILTKVDNSLVTNKDSKGNYLYVELSAMNNNAYDLFRINDAWGTPLRYTYFMKGDSTNSVYYRDDSFPLIESAGPDKVFGDNRTNPGDGQDVSYSEDNIKNR